MITRQKKFITISALIILGVIGWIVYPQYGSGYSEDQRRNWNELLAAPKHDRNWCVSYAEKHFGDALKEMQAVVTRRRAEDAPQIDVSSIPRHPDITALPLEGLTLTELVNLAESGNEKINADACLELVFRRMSDKDTKQGPFLAQEQEKWLRKAVGMKRPGSPFLLEWIHLCQKNDAVTRPILTDSASFISLPSGKNTPASPSSVEGYGSFMEEIRKGDLPLYKVWSRLPDGVRASCGVDDLFCSSMDKEDPPTMKKLGYRFFLLYSEDQLENEMRRQKNSQVIKAGNWADSCRSITDSNAITEETLESIFLTAFRILGLYQQTELRDANIKNTELLKRAAEHGDMTAKYLWLSRGLQYKEFFTEEEWKAAYSYTLDLLKAGFAPLYDDISNGDNILQKYRGMHYALYTGDSMNSLMDAAYEAMFPRGSRQEITRHIGHHSWRSRREEKNDQKIISLLTSMSGIDSQEMIRHSEMVFGYSSDIVHQHYIPLLEKVAADGSAEAYYYLARACEEGKGTPQDIPRAWKHIGEILKWKDFLADTDCLADKEKWFYKRRLLPYNWVISFYRIDFVLRHGDQPDMTLQQAWDEYRSLIELNQSNHSSNSFVDSDNIDPTLDEFKKEFEKKGMKLPEGDDS